VQWNGSANNPLARNVGEALAVFANFSVTAANDADRFQSTVNVRMRSGTTTASFALADLTTKGRVQVLGEDRSLEIEGGRFRDTFQLWDVHLYRIPSSNE
jgi:hypothetical protein